VIWPSTFSEVCCKNSYYRYLLEIRKSTTNTLVRECLTTPSGEDYMGHTNHTAFGTPCQRWSDKRPHNHAYDDIKYFADYMTSPSAIIHDVANYCRNPSVLSSVDAQPWCFTSNEHIEKEYCVIPRCKSKRVIYDCV